MDEIEEVSYMIISILVIKSGVIHVSFYRLLN